MSLKVVIPTPLRKFTAGAETVEVEAATIKAGTSRQTLKYPSDRDEIDFYVAPHGNAADAR